MWGAAYVNELKGESPFTKYTFMNYHIVHIQYIMILFVKYISIRQKKKEKRKAWTVTCIFQGYFDSGIKYLIIVRHIINITDICRYFQWQPVHKAMCYPFLPEQRYVCVSPNLKFSLSFPYYVSESHLDKLSKLINMIFSKMTHLSNWHRF